MERAHPKRWAQATLAWTLVFVVGAVVFIFALATLPADPSESAGKSWWTAAVIGMAAMCLIIMGIQRRYHRQSEGMTLSIRGQVVIARPNEEIFAFLADIRNDAHWTPQIIETRQTSPGPFGLGTTYRHVMRVMGRTIDTDWTITAYQPPHHLAVDGTVGKQRQGGSYTLTSVPQGTLVTATSEMPSNPLSLPLHSLIRTLLQSQVRATLARLKKVMEDSPA